ncbi:unnamed protein product [Sphagnum jensenii]
MRALLIAAGSFLESLLRDARRIVRGCSAHRCLGIILRARRPESDLDSDLQLLLLFYLAGRLRQDSWIDWVVLSVVFFCWSPRHANVSFLAKGTAVLPVIYFGLGLILQPQENPTSYRAIATEHVVNRIVVDHRNDLTPSEKIDINQVSDFKCLSEKLSSYENDQARECIKTSSREEWRAFLTSYPALAIKYSDSTLFSRSDMFLRNMGVRGLEFYATDELLPEADRDQDVKQLKKELGLAKSGAALDATEDYFKWADLDQMSPGFSLRRLFLGSHLIPLALFLTLFGFRRNQNWPIQCAIALLFLKILTVTLFAPSATYKYLFDVSLISWFLIFYLNCRKPTV